MTLTYCRERGRSLTMSKHQFEGPVAAEKTVRLSSHYITDCRGDTRADTSWFRKQSSTSFLEPAIDLARRLSVKINGPRGSSLLLCFLLKTEIEF